YNYIEPALTNDLDILVSFDTPANLHEPIYAYLRSKGYDQRKEGIVIEEWPVQFLPVANSVDVEALAQADDIQVEINREEAAIKTRILLPEHLIANALRAGRPQDLIRIAQFVQEEAVDISALCGLLDRHNLKDIWQSFCRRTGDRDPCKLDLKRMSDPPKDNF